MSYGYGRHDFRPDFGQNYSMNGYDLSSTRYDSSYEFTNRNLLPRQIAYTYDTNFPNQSGKKFFSNLEKSTKFKNFLNFLDDALINRPHRESYASPSGNFDEKNRYYHYLFDSQQRLNGKRKFYN